MRRYCHQKKADNILLFVRLTPNSSRDEVTGLMDGIDGPVLAAKVRAIPDKGKANKALIKLVAKWLGVAKADVSLKSGGKSRLKTLKINGEAEQLTASLEQKLSG